MIRLITFDLDNTLWDVETVIVRAEEKMQNWIKTHVPTYKLVSQNKTLSEKLRKKISKEQPAIRHDVSSLRLAYLTEMFLHCQINPREATQLAKDAFSVFMQWRNKVVFFDGALDTLKLLASDYELAALTNGNADITRVGLDKYLSFAINAADVGASKPAPDMFIAALKKSGARPTESIHIGDNPIDDIEGANSAGLFTIWVNLNSTEKNSIATSTVHDLRSIEAAVTNIDTQS